MTRRPLSWGAWLLLGLAAAAVFAPLAAPYDPNASLDLIRLKSQPPSWAHPFGTDPYSRDVLSRVLYGTRVSVSFALLTVGLVIGIGTTYGAVMAFAPPLLSTVLQRTLDLLLAVPRLLILLAVAGVAGPLSLPVLVLLTAGTGWYACARLVNDELVALGSREFTLAARAIGVPTGRLVVRHLLPHVAPTLMTLATIAVAGTIGLEAGLSFLGFGVQPPQATWGNIIADSKTYILDAWWLILFPGLAILIASLSFYLAGDALREAAESRG